MPWSDNDFRYSRYDYNRPFSSVKISSRNEKRFMGMTSRPKTPHIKQPLRAVSGHKRPKSGFPESRSGSPIKGRSSSPEDWVSSMRVRLESKFKSENSETRIEPRSASLDSPRQTQLQSNPDQGNKTISFNHRRTSNSLSLLPLARNCNYANNGYNNYDDNNNKNENNHHLTTTGRMYRYSNDGFAKARSLPFVRKPSIKIAVEEDLSNKNDQSLLHNEEQQNLPTITVQTLSKMSPTGQLRVDGKAALESTGKKLMPLSTTTYTCYTDNYSGKNVSKEDLRPIIVRPISSIKTGLEGKFQDRVTSKEEYPIRPYCRTLPEVRVDQLCVSTKAVRMCDITTYKREINDPKKYENLKPALRFNSLYKRADNIDWI